MSKNNGLGLRTSDNTHRIEVTTYEGARFWVEGKAAPAGERWAAAAAAERILLLALDGVI